LRFDSAWPDGPSPYGGRHRRERLAARALRWLASRQPPDVDGDDEGDPDGDETGDDGDQESSATGIDDANQSQADYMARRRHRDTSRLAYQRRCVAFEHDGVAADQREARRVSRACLEVVHPDLPDEAGAPAPVAQPRRLIGAGDRQLGR
jgi:hypothetical protein